MNRGLFASLCFCVALLGGASAHAACESDGLRMFPSPGSVIPTNTRFILEGLGKSQRAVSELTNSTLSLKSADGDVVPVKVQKQVWRSAVNRVAVTLRPARDLLPNKEYRLLLAGELRNAKLLNPEGEKGLAWNSGRSRDDRAPEWEERPTVSEGEYIFRGRELSRHIKLRMTLTEDSPSYLLIQMRRARGAVNLQTYFIPVNGGEAEMGHDGCTGSFGFEDGGQYKAKVEVYDAAGNRANVTADIEFLAPAAAN